MIRRDNALLVGMLIPGGDEAHQLAAAPGQQQIIEGETEKGPRVGAKVALGDDRKELPARPLLGEQVEDAGQIVPRRMPNAQARIVTSRARFPQRNRQRVIQTDGRIAGKSSLRGGEHLESGDVSRGDRGEVIRSEAVAVQAAKVGVASGDKAAVAIGRQQPQAAEIAHALRLAIDVERSHFEEVSVDLKDKTITVQTACIELDYVDFGPFNIVLHWERIGQGRAFDVIAKEPNRSQVNDRVTHPHVREDELCEGEGTTAIHAALASGRLLDFFVLGAADPANLQPRQRPRLDRQLEWRGVPRLRLLRGFRRPVGLRSV